MRYGPVFLCLSKPVVMKNLKHLTDIKIATVGYGGAFNMGKAHFEQAAQAGMTPAAVVELDPSRRQAAEEDFPGISTYGSVAELIASEAAHVAVVLTPHNSHYTLGKELLEGGVYTILEKPMAITGEECDELIEIANQKGLLVTAYHNRHWDGAIMAVNKLIKEDRAIGEIYKIQIRMGKYQKPAETWRGSKSISGGITYDFGAHCLDYAMQLFDEDPIEVSGFKRDTYWKSQSNWEDDTIEDEVFFTLRYASGRWLTFTISKLDDNLQDQMVEVTGTKGTCTFNPENYKLATRTSDGYERVERYKIPNAYHLFYDNFAQALRGEGSLTITPEWATKIIRILDLANQSAEQGQALRISK